MFRHLFWQIFTILSFLLALTFSHYLITKKDKMETIQNDRKVMVKDKSNFWGALLNFGVRAIGAVVGEFSKANGSDVVQEEIGPIEIRKVDNKTMAFNTVECEILLYATATDQNGKMVKKMETLIPKKAKIPSGKDISELLANGLTGSLSWSKFGTDSVNIEPGRAMLSVQAFQKGGRISMFEDDLVLLFNTEKNFISVSSENHDYDDVQIMVISSEGEVFDFGPFPVKKNTPVYSEYPPYMEERLPITRVTMWAKCDKEKYNKMIKNLS